MISFDTHTTHFVTTLAIKDDFFDNINHLIEQHSMSNVLVVVNCPEYAEYALTKLCDGFATSGSPKLVTTPEKLHSVDHVFDMVVITELSLILHKIINTEMIGDIMLFKLFQICSQQAKFVVCATHAVGQDASKAFVDSLKRDDEVKVHDGDNEQKIQDLFLNMQSFNELTVNRDKHYVFITDCNGSVHEIIKKLRHEKDVLNIVALIQDEITSTQLEPLIKDNNVVVIKTSYIAGQVDANVDMLGVVMNNSIVPGSLGVNACMFNFNNVAQITLV